MWRRILPILPIIAVGDIPGKVEIQARMSDQATVASVLSHYPDVVVRGVDPLKGAGGFSGATFWRVDTGDTQLCLRRWPQEHPSRAQLQAIHDVLCHVSANGFANLPVPFRSRDGQTFVGVTGHLWELTLWLPGQADFHEHPTPERLDAALIALAQFHQSARSLGSRTGTPPGIEHRCEQLERLRTPGANDMSSAVATCEWPEFQQRATTLLHWFNERASTINTLLSATSHLCVPLQPCIRDIWHDHVLFQGNEVSGFVDFGAMRTDHVACDISRLLGSLVGSDKLKWKQGLSAYQSLRPLSPEELALVDAYDRSTVLLSGMSWVEWVAVEGRKFEDRRRILKRLDDIVLRLQQM